MEFAEFIAPISEERFLSDYWGRQPLHIPARAQPRPDLLNWQWLNGILGVLPHWTPGNLKLVMDTQPILPEHYTDEVETADGVVRRANPARVDLFMAMGASLVANSVEDVSPEVRQVTSMLSRKFAAVSVANAYCSFKDVQAFDSHYDIHDVFAVHIEGEKRWRIYRNRAEAPIVQMPEAESKAIIPQVKGPLLMEVTMRPGDLLYIPRGYIHDALAGSGASLHVTYAVSPYDGRLIFRILEGLASEDPEFRAYLPDARTGGGTGLRSTLERLSQRASEMMRTPRFEAEIAARQQMQLHSSYDFALPDRPKLDFYARTQRPAEVAIRDDGAFLRWNGGEAPLGALAEPARWALGQAAFSKLQLFSLYGWAGRDRIEELVALLDRTGLFAPYALPQARISS